MITQITIPERIYCSLVNHLFIGRKEQGAFLFADAIKEKRKLELRVNDAHLIPSKGWAIQSEYHLELRDDEKVNIMKIAKAKGSHLIEFHSHRFKLNKVGFSASDIYGIKVFVEYVQWKLPGKIYGAVVLDKCNATGLLWIEKGADPVSLNEIKILKRKNKHDFFKLLITEPSEFKLEEKIDYYARR